MAAHGGYERARGAIIQAALDRFATVTRRPGYRHGRDRVPEPRSDPVAVRMTPSDARRLDVAVSLPVQDELAEADVVGSRELVLHG